MIQILEELQHHLHHAHKTLTNLPAQAQDANGKLAAANHVFLTLLL
jgi:hypothetical protein